MENVKEAKITEITEITENKCKQSSCTLSIALFSLIFTINVGIGTYFAYSHWYLKKDITCIKFGTHTQTTI